MLRNEGILVGLDKLTEEPMTIDQVASGRACRCLCPECGTALVAKKGEKNAHHFAHDHLPESIRSCQETALHLAAKTVAAHLIDFLHLPEREKHFTSNARYISSSGRFHPEHHRVSVCAGDYNRLAGAVEPIVPEISPFRPDARIETKFGPIFIEIRVTHPVEPVKQAAMKQADLAVLELDFSDVPRSGLTLFEIKALVTSRVARSWVSDGLEKYKAKALPKIDRAIKKKEQEAHAALIESLQQRPGKHVINEINVFSVKHKLSGASFDLAGRLPLQNLRCKNRFWLADLPGVPGVLVTMIKDEKHINRLFGWHQSIKNHPLTVLSLSENTTVYSNSLSINREIRKYLQGNALIIPGPISKAMVTDDGCRSVTLDIPITEEFILELGDRAFVADSVSRSTVYELMDNGFVDLIVSFEDVKNEAFITSAIAKQLCRTRPSGGMRDSLIDKIRSKQRCSIRFVPSVAERLKGNLFDRLVIYRGEIYLEDDVLGRQRIYLNRVDFWKKGGLLILPNHMRRGDYLLEPSGSFLSALRGAETS